MSLFSRQSPEALGAARNALSPEQRAGFDQAAKVDGVQIAEEADPETVKLFQRHGLAFNPHPDSYDFPKATNMDELKAARAWASSAGLLPGFARAVVDRVSETAPAWTALKPDDQAQKIADAQKFLGDDQYKDLLAKAKSVIGDFKSLQPGQLESDSWLLGSLGRLADSKASLAEKLAKQ